MSLAFMNYLNINQNIWHTATVSDVAKTGLSKVCCPLNATRMQCKRLCSVNSLPACRRCCLLLCLHTLCGEMGVCGFPLL